MARLRYRWLLPLGHALVDVIVLSHFIWYGYKAQSVECGQPPVVRTAPSTRDGAVGWDPRVVSGAPWDYYFLATGTPPAGLIAHAARPKAGWQTCDRVWDPMWFSIHEAIALLFWFLVGGWLDSPGAPLRKLLGVYLGLRFAFALRCWLPRMSDQVGPKVEYLFWLVFAVCVLVQGCLWLLRRKG